MSQLHTRAVTGIIASLSGAAALLAVFRIGIEAVGADVVGCWALLQGIFLLSRLPDSAAGANVLTFTASAFNEGRRIFKWRTAGAAIVLGTLPVSAVCGVVYPAAFWYVTRQYGHVLDPTVIAQLALFAVLSGIGLSASSGLLSVLEGAGRLRTRNLITISANMLNVAVAYPAILVLGAAGFGASFVASACLQTVLGLAALARIHDAKEAENEPFRPIWRQLLGGNLILSAAALVRLSFEPATKLFLSAMGPLSLIAAFELALRVSMQMRFVMQAVVQPLAVFGARPGPIRDRRVSRGFVVANRANAQLSMAGAQLLVVASPIVSLLGLGSIAPEFITILIILTVGNLLNMFGLVGYMYQLVSNSYVSLLKIQLVMAAANTLIGGAGVLLGSPALVVGSYATAFATGGLLSLTMFLRDESISARRFAREAVCGRPLIALAGSGSAALASTLYFPNTAAAVAITLLLSGVLLALAIRPISHAWMRLFEERSEGAI